MTKNKDKKAQFYESPWFIAPAIFVIALTATLAYIVYFQAVTGEWIFSITSITKLSNIHRNIGIVFFSFFGGGLAIWARFAHQKQLKQTDKQIDNTVEQLNYTYQQIKNSVTANRNDRFAKVADMLGKDKSETSHGSGLHILYDLIIEEEEDIDEIRYMRCYDMIADWLRQNQGSPELRMNAMKMLWSNIGNYHNEIVADYKTGHGLSLWPNLRNVDLKGLNLRRARLPDADLRGANLAYAILEEANLKGANLDGANLQGANLQNTELQGANLQSANLQSANLQNTELQGANLQGAKLQGANLDGANLENANLKDAVVLWGRRGLVVGGISELTNLKNAKGLTEKQVKQIKWEYGNAAGEKHKPIELPDELMQNPELREWLKNPPSLYEWGD